MKPDLSFTYVACVAIDHTGLASDIGVGMGMMRRVMVSFLYCPVRISNSRFLNNAFAASISYLIGKPKWALRPSVVRAKGSFKDTRI